MFTNTLLNFTLKTKIGAGGEAEVFLADDHQLNAEIVIKKIPKSNFTNLVGYFEESQKLYFTKHHNVVEIMYGCQDSTNIFLAMPYYSNGSLKTIIDSRYLTSREIIRYALQFLSGLNNIHSKQLLHYDIKPENILIDESNRALISDFGLAEYMGAYGFANISGTTKELAPPELFVQPVHNVKFDIYQAGLTLYRMCNGDGVFLNQLNDAFISGGIASDTNFINNLNREKFPDRTYYLPHIPRPLKKIITTALKANPNERYDSVLDILNDLSKISNASDWQYSKMGDIEQWVKMPNYLVTCTLDSGKNSYTIVALKNNRRNSKYCSTQSSKRDAHNAVYDCLNTDW
jgi:serine/threonine protein kinase